MTVTKQQQLEWLANKITKWPDDRTIGYMMSRDEVGFVVGLFTRVSSYDPLTGYFHVITRAEWQQERDKMQKQDGKVMSENEFEDELEKMYWDFDAERAKKSKCERLNFKMFMRIASGLRVERKQDSSWHERGELPPVGCECEWVDESGVDGAAGAVYPDIGDVVSICAHKQTPGGDVIAIFTWEPGGDGLSVAASRMPSDFRPLRTEREKAIDALIEIICAGGELSKDGSAAREIAERLYDAGMLK